MITVNVEHILLPNGRVGRYEIVHHPGGAAVVALDEADRVCLLRQFRPAGGGWVWELPAGRLEPGEAPEATARRELAEEAGREARCWESLGSILSSPGVFAETIHLFMARELLPVPPAHEPHEVIQLHWVELHEAARRALDGELRDGKTIAGLLRAMHRIRPER
ncbi:MAG TPA: NUDIX hydrolase [Steroidobacteraceae bacterium]|nr:NUDIX hydrolase [Steroidobacteraceae bacterium]